METKTTSTTNWPRPKHVLWGKTIGLAYHFPSFPSLQILSKVPWSMYHPTIQKVGFVLEFGMSTTPGPFVQSTALFLAKGMVPTFAQRCHTQCSKFLSFHEILVGYERDFQFVDDDHSQYSGSWSSPMTTLLSWGFALTGRHMFERAERVQALPKLRPMVRARETSRCCLFTGNTGCFFLKTDG